MEKTPFVYVILRVDVGIVFEHSIQHIHHGKKVGDEYLYKTVDTWKKRFYLTLESAQEAMSHLILTNLYPKRTFEIVPLYL